MIVRMNKMKFFLEVVGGVGDEGDGEVNSIGDLGV
jgi:hypothetical protein